MRLSVSMIILNEEKNIAGAIESIYPIADEIIIVDTGSTDLSKKICKQYDKVKLFDYEWNDNYADARNFGLEKCSGDWILVIDADERMTNHEGLTKLMNGKCDAWQVIQLSIVRGQEIRNNTNRLWKNHNGVKYLYPYHEVPIFPPEFKIGKSNLAIMHLGYKENSKEKNAYIIKLLKNSEHPLKNMYLGQSYFNLGDYQNSLIHLQLAIKNDMTAEYKAFCYNLIATINWKIISQSYLELIYCLDESIKLVKEQIQVHLIASDVYQFHSQYDKAIEELNIILEQNNISDLHLDSHLTKEQIQNLINQIKKEKQNVIINNS